jgi:potassium-transporting ATPase KdpC subunit
MKHLRTALLALLFFTVLTGIVYPFVVLGLARALFPHRAAGSMVGRGGSVFGSALIGQGFASPAYFHGRPSAGNWDAANSGGSNFGPTNPKLLAQVGERVAAVQAENNLPDSVSVPADLVLASASGLDPDISPAAALLQVGRVAAARAADSAVVRRLVLRHTTRPFLGTFGPARVNVLLLNLALDSVAPPPLR